MSTFIPKKKATNCPNCGAPLETGKYKCEFCGTRYIDFESFDLYEPTIIRINTGTRDRPRYFQMKMALVDVELTGESYPLFVDSFSAPDRMLKCEPMWTMNLEFKSV